MENLMEKRQFSAAYDRLRGWYKEAPEYTPKPMLLDETKTRAEYERLFTAEQPSGNPLPLHYNPTEVNDHPPSEEEVQKALKGMKRKKAPGGSGIRVEHLLEWMNSEKGTEKGCAWEKVLELIDRIFKGEDIPQSFGTGILVLIPKSTPGQYRGIALLEIIYKLISAIINRRLVASIRFHDAIHGFRTYRGTGTAILEAKLRMQLAMRSTEPNFMVFLDLKKAYDTLDRNRTLAILKGYGIGEKVQKIIQQIWHMDTMYPKQAGFFGKPFRANRGVRQGDIISPMIFNIVADAVIRHTEWKCLKEGKGLITSLFYADDGLLMGTDEKTVQYYLDSYTENFARVGLKMNSEKTKAMIVEGGKFYGAQSTEAYNRRMTGVGNTAKRQGLQKVNCDLCGATVNKQHLRTHQSRQICIENRSKQPVPTTYTPQPKIIQEFHCISIQENRKTPCPMKDCTFSSNNASQMRRHFRARHVEHTVIIQEEGPLPRCTECGLFQKDVGWKHQHSEDCKRWAKSLKGRKQTTENATKIRNLTFTVNNTPIENVTDFKYLGRILTNKDNDTAAVEANLVKARNRWARVRKVLVQNGANPKHMVSFYLTIIQAILLYGAETWVLSDAMERKLSSFHNRCARYLTHMPIHQSPEGTWIVPSTAQVLKCAKLLPIQEYIRKRRETVKKYAITREILTLCTESRPLASNPNQLVWWKLDEEDC
jgi:hypothetical protein